MSNNITEPHLRVVAHHPHPVLTNQSAGAHHVRYGFEGGRVVKQAGVYHLFTTEMLDDPLWVATALAYWTSPDGFQWTRQATLRQSSRDYTGNDPRAALWSPIPIYDEESERWNLFYVAYRSAPDTAERMLTNHAGRIWRAISAVPGRAGIAGPYEDVDVVFSPGPLSDPWEGLQGTDSFFPYRVGSRWYAFYGSARTECLPIIAWQVGLAEAAALGGPWKRLSQHNPLAIEPRFLENPIVTRLSNGLLVAVYDTDINDAHALGWAWSEDGLAWKRGTPIQVPDRKLGGWVDITRTPLGLILEQEDCATLFYTGYQHAQDFSPEPGEPIPIRGTAYMGVLTLSLQERPS